MTPMMRELRILLITSRADTGGGPKHVLDLLQGLKEAKAPAALFIAAPKGEPFFKKYEALAAGMVEIPHRKFSLSAFLKLLRYAKQNQIVVLHSHGRGAGIYSRLLKPFGFKVIHTFHGVHAGAGFKARVALGVERVLAGFTDGFINVAQGEREKALVHHLLRAGRERVIHNGIDVQAVAIEVEKRRGARTDSAAQAKTMVLGTLARLDHQKGIDLLLQGIATYVSKHPAQPLEVRIAGGGEKTQTNAEMELKALCAQLGLSERVKFLGEVSEPLNFLADLDVYISFSRGEGLPLSVLEAGAAGLPVLLSNVAGHRDFLGPVLFDSTSGFCQALEQVFGDEQFRTASIARFREDLKARFGLNKMVSETFAFYEKVAGESK